MFQNPTAAHQNRPRQQKKRAPRRKGSLSFSYLVGMNVAERLAGLSPWKRDSVANIITRVLAKAELQSLKKGNTIAIPKDILPLIVLVHRFLTEIFCNGHGDDPPQYYPFLAQVSCYCAHTIIVRFGRSLPSPPHPCSQKKFLGWLKLRDFVPLSTRLLKTSPLPFYLDCEQ